MHIRPLTQADLDMILSWRNAPAVRQNMYTSHEISPEEHRAWFARVEGDNTKRYFVFERDGVGRGVIGFTAIDTNNKRSSWAFYASPDAPRGTGSAMEYLALEYAFNELALLRLHCEVLDFNRAVIQLHQSFGFTIEGTLREHHYNGERYCDVVLLGILNDEWQQRRAAIRQKLRLDEVAS
ncbi:UDP-4-amino-4,6-dideoxy-N-acetyl-beta-L-altrosamine N-acetyltransferase [Paraburkholderia flagellata]|uniref:UDP-4-amino-4, 6-dideoxy-N-acetyl-beta-L-altrosamine N-acetyltransferase n=1 Tax=Paraburkholderia flagellata TaxID=2883241 RepID=UPI00227796BC|nr:UDP-4-amino-4,6-dideoxy-N-acetyl-beta-L-altrosamine N-acetyltransferase [Paraburkholderia flagellata]